MPNDNDTSLPITGVSLLQHIERLFAEKDKRDDERDKRTDVKFDSVRNAIEALDLRLTRDTQQVQDRALRLERAHEDMRDDMERLRSLFDGERADTKSSFAEIRSSTRAILTLISVLGTLVMVVGGIVAIVIAL